MGRPRVRKLETALPDLHGYLDSGRAVARRNEDRGGGREGRSLHVPAVPRAAGQRIRAARLFGNRLPRGYRRRHEPDGSEDIAGASGHRHRAGRLRDEHLFSVPYDRELRRRIPAGSFRGPAVLSGQRADDDRRPRRAFLHARQNGNLDLHRAVRPRQLERFLGRLLAGAAAHAR